jgi:hypothetical protein
MDVELKNKWVTKLRSDEYAQGTGELRNWNDKFCCLGVLCDVMDKDNWVNRYAESAESAEEEDAIEIQWDYLFNGQEDGTEAPDWLEDLLADNVDYVELNLDENTDRIVTTLVEFNDSKSLTFSEIADWVEANL